MPIYIILTFINKGFRIACKVQNTGDPASLMTVTIDLCAYERFGRKEIKKKRKHRRQKHKNNLIFMLG